MEFSLFLSLSLYLLCFLLIFKQTEQEKKKDDDCIKTISDIHLDTLSNVHLHEISLELNEVNNGKVSQNLIVNSQIKITKKLRSLDFLQRLEWMCSI